MAKKYLQMRAFRGTDFPLLFHYFFRGMHTVFVFQFSIKHYKEPLPLFYMREKQFQLEIYSMLIPAEVSTTNKFTKTLLPTL